MRPAVLLPVKSLHQAKQRLAPLLPPEARRGLAELLLRGTLQAIAGLPPQVARVLVTSDPAVMALGRTHGFRILEETRQTSESASVDEASARLESDGITGVLRVPLDLPLLATGDLESLLVRARAGYRTVVVPSRDGTGSNAVYRQPPTLFPSRFGPDSLPQHLALAQAATPHWQLCANPAIALDVDDPGDVQAVLRLAPDSAAAAYLRQVLPPSADAG